MVYYKGGLTYSELTTMPIPKILDFIDYSVRINVEIEKQAKVK